jgi:hypothetical protein
MQQMENIKKPKEDIPVWLLKSFEAFGEVFLSNCRTVELAFMLIRESKCVHQQFFNIKYPYKRNNKAIKFHPKTSLIEAKLW